MSMMDVIFKHVGLETIKRCLPDSSIYHISCSHILDFRNAKTFPAVSDVVKLCQDIESCYAYNDATEFQLKQGR